MDNIDQFNKLAASLRFEDESDTPELGDELSDSELHELFDSMLDDCYGNVRIASYEYATSHALKNLDETAYRCGFNDWLDSEVSEGNIIEQNDTYYKPY